MGKQKNYKLKMEGSHMKPSLFFFHLLLLLFCQEVLKILIISYISIYTFIAAVEYAFRIRYKLTNDQLESAKSKKFLIIGGGFSGLAIGHFFRLMGLNFEIIEKGDSIGGTWFWNKYPGVGCDVVSHLYSYSFFKNPNWSKSFSLGDEILRYMVNFWKFAKLQEKEKYDWIISCIGALTKPSMANFAEMQKFQGEIVHSAEWTGPKLDGKRIALIGTGASSIQILPRLIKDSKAKRVTLFQRTAPFVFPRGQVEFSENWKSAMSFYPLGVLWRWYEYLIREFLYFAVWKNYTGFFNKLMQQKFEKDLKATIKNKTLAQQLTP